MATGSNALRFITVFLFAAAIVALGAHELNQRYSSQRVRDRDNMKRLVSDLKDDGQDVRASLARKREGSDSSRSSDALDSNDKSALSELLSKFSH